MTAHALALRHLSKSFSAPRLAPLARGKPSRNRSCEVLHDVNLEVARGEIVGVLGANGAGKTTLLEILSTLLQPTSGEALVYDRNVVADAAAVRELVGYCPCGFDTFYPRLTAAANLEFFAALNGFQFGSGKRRLNELFDLLGINGSRHVDFQRHSTGMKQKLVLARALLTDPAVLLLDEPTKSLDPRAQREFWTLLRRTLTEGLKRTVLLVTHSLAEAQEVCDRVVILQSGMLAEIANPEAITSRDLTEMFEVPTLDAPKPWRSHV